jgi:ATP adenylyltransferase
MKYFFNFNKMEYLKGSRPEGCILCLIRDSSSDVKKLVVHTSPLFIVSVNLYPYNPGHLLIFPKRHLVDIRQFSAEEDQELTMLRRVVLNTLDSTHNPNAYNIGYNMGQTAGASIEHLHLHIIPRYPRETGIADIIAGKRVLVEDPHVTVKRVRKSIKRFLP